MTLFKFWNRRIDKNTDKILLDILNELRDIKILLHNGNVVGSTQPIISNKVESKDVVPIYIPTVNLSDYDDKTSNKNTRVKRSSDATIDDAASTLKSMQNGEIKNDN